MRISSAFFVITGLIMLLSYRILYEGIAPKREKKVAEGPSLNPRRILTIASLIAVIVAFTSGEITYVYVSETLGLTKQETAVLLGWTGFLAALLSYFVSWVADVGSEARMVRLTALLAGISPVLAALKTAPTVFLGIFLAIFAFQSFKPLSRKVLASYHRSSLAIGGVNAVQNISTFAGGMLFGLAYSLGEVRAGLTLNLALLVFLPFSLGLIFEALQVGKR